MKTNPDPAFPIIFKWLSKTLIIIFRRLFCFVLKEKRPFKNNSAYCKIYILHGAPICFFTIFFLMLA